MKAHVATLAIVAALTGCGGGGGSGPAPSLPGPPAGVTQSIALPSTGGYGGTMLLTLANGASGASADVTAGTSPPPGVPAPADTDQSLLFVGLSLSAIVTSAGLPAFLFTVPQSALQSTARAPQSSDFALLLDFFDPGNPSAGYQPAETCSMSGATVTCSGGSALVNLLAKLVYVFRLKRRALTSPATPTPAPSPTPATGSAVVIIVPTPAPVVCSPSPVVVGVNAVAVFVCTARGYGAAFSFGVADPSIASVQQSNDLTFTYFSVTGLRPGTTTFSLRSKPGGAGSVAITVAQ